MNDKLAEVNGIREVWSINDEEFVYDDLGELIDSNECEVGQVVYFGEAYAVSPKRLFDADDLIDALADRACDVAGEHADGWPYVSAEGKAEFDTFLAEWLTKHCPPTFWEMGKSQAYTITAEDLAP